MARVLAASKPGGLLLNVEAPELSFFLGDGMDITSQLVSVNSDPDVHAAARQRLGDDIRISVRAQHPVEFLGDVPDHRFDLVIFGELEPLASRLAASSFAPGGLLAAFHQAPMNDGGGGQLGQTLTDCGLRVAPGVNRWLVAFRTADGGKARRRGGQGKRSPVRR